MACSHCLSGVPRGDQGATGLFCPHLGTEPLTQGHSMFEKTPTITRLVDVAPIVTPHLGWCSTVVVSRCTYDAGHKVEHDVVVHTLPCQWITAGVGGVAALLAGSAGFTSVARASLA